ncbi:hypothetical protein [Micromonospora sp. KC721]|uniref:hypothetical protein n=1 Tax=Micromonospora sp. KC721 TaxID=2530380 RepID=UPI00104CC79E|nr:hypothetical protein [Micromonospora sp. KC721]TDB80940.1 hypothetical protein E1182_06995 [Micromonospora sp. KC721]
MGKRTIQAGRRAVVECKPYGSCYDDEDRCIHCGNHIGDPDLHGPGCLHGDEPGDECDARPTHEESVGEPERVQAYIELRGHGGVELVRRAVETLLDNGFNVAGRSVQVFRAGDGLPEWIGVVTLPDRG